MSTDTIKRKRKVDVEKLDDQQLELLISQISDKIIAMVDQTCNKANELLNIYGLETKMQIVIQPKETKKEE